MKRSERHIAACWALCTPAASALAAHSLLSAAGRHGKNEPTHPTHCTTTCFGAQLLALPLLCHILHRFATACNGYYVLQPCVTCILQGGSQLEGTIGDGMARIVNSGC